MEWFSLAESWLIICSFLCHQGVWQGVGRREEPHCRMCNCQIRSICHGLISLTWVAVWPDLWDTWREYALFGINSNCLYPQLVCSDNAIHRDMSFGCFMFICFCWPGGLAGSLIARSSADTLVSYCRWYWWYTCHNIHIIHWLYTCHTLIQLTWLSDRGKW